MFFADVDFFAGVGFFGGFVGFVEFEGHLWRSAKDAWVVGGKTGCDKWKGSSLAM